MGEKVDPRRAQAGPECVREQRVRRVGKRVENYIFRNRWRYDTSNAQP